MRALNKLENDQLRTIPTKLKHVVKASCIRKGVEVPEGHNPAYVTVVAFVDEAVDDVDILTRSESCPLGISPK